MSEQLTVGGWTFLGAGAVLGAVGIWLAAMAPSDSRLANWARKYGFNLTPVNRPTVAGYLRRTRVLQVACGALAFLASPLYVGVSGHPFPLGDNWVALAVGGYLVGAVAAEMMSVKRPAPATSVRAAGLSPRALTDYVPAATVWAIRILPLTTIALLVTYVVAPKDPLRSIGGTSVASLVVGSILLVVFAVAVEAILRVIVARPQPAMSPDIVAADDAVRASSIHALSGAAVALMLLSAAWALDALSAAAWGTVLTQLLPWLALLTDLLALASWIVLGHPRTWRVHREAPLVGAL